MEKLKLMKPNKNFENQVLDMVQEFYNDNSTPY
jgi:predicted acetyltransferase